MIIERDLDGGGLYELVRLRLAALIRACSPAELEVLVPATPAWRVRDALAHVVGIARDLNHQDFPAQSPEEWTARQVDVRRDLPIGDVLAEWEAEAPRFVAGLRDFGYEFGAHFTADLLQHESDVRRALDRPVVPDDDALRAGLDWYLDVAHRALTDAGVGPVETVADGEHVRIGAGAAGGGAAIASVAASRYELFRALGARRTLDELRELDWSGDLDVAALLPAYPAPATSVRRPVR